MPARNFYRKEPVGLGTQINGGRTLKIPSTLPIPNLEAIRDTDGDMYQALNSLQEGMGMLAVHVSALEGNVGDKPRPPLNATVAYQYTPSPGVLLSWTPDSMSETPVAYYKVYRATAGNSFTPSTPTYDQGVFLFAVVAQDLAYLVNGSYTVMDGNLSGATGLVYPGAPSRFSYWVSSVDRFGRESYAAPCAGSPVTLAPSPYQNLQFLNLSRGMNLFFNGKGIGTATSSVAGTTAVTAATNAAPIQITSTAHGLLTGDRCVITGSVGNTSANGHWYITKVDANNFTLNGSQGNGAWTSGGTVYPMVGQPMPAGPQDANGNYAKSPWYKFSGTAPTFNASAGVAGNAIKWAASQTGVVAQDFLANAAIGNLGTGVGVLYITMLITPTSANPPSTGSVTVSSTLSGWSTATWSPGTLTQDIPVYVVFPITGSAGSLGSAFTIKIANNNLGFAPNMTDIMMNNGFQPLPFTEYEEPSLAGYAQAAWADTGIGLSSAAPPF